VDPLALADPKARLRFLRDFLRTLPPGRFDMKYWAATEEGNPVSRQKFLTDCGTAGCIGGWTMALFQTGRNLHQTTSSAGRFLGLDEEQASALFFPEGTAAWNAPQEGAANVLDHLLRTGEVDWSQAGPA
jgi:hypothetical protein